MPVLAAAQSCPAGGRCLPVNIGTSRTIPEIAARVVHYLSVSISTVASVMFLAGALMLVLSGAKEDYKQKGKDLMLGSLLALGVVLGAYAIWNTVIYVLTVL